MTGTTQNPRRTDAFERLTAHKGNNETIFAVVVRLVGGLQTTGYSVGDEGMIIDATAAAVDEPVLTRNVDDFQRLDIWY